MIGLGFLVLIFRMIHQIKNHFAFVPPILALV